MKRFSELLIEAFIGGILYMIFWLLIIEILLQFNLIKYRYLVNKCYNANRKYILLFIFFISFLSQFILYHLSFKNITKLFCN